MQLMLTFYVIHLITTVYKTTHSIKKSLYFNKFVCDSRTIEIIILLRKEFLTLRSSTTPIKLHAEEGHTYLEAAVTNPSSIVNIYIK